MATFASDGTPDGTATLPADASKGIQSIHDNRATHGDVITMPNGTFDWKVKLTLTKAITLQGNGVNVTIVKDSVASGMLLQGRMVEGHRSGPTDFSKPHLRITGIKFIAGSRTTGAFNSPSPPDPYNSGGIINFAGHDQRTDSMFRFDNCAWEGLNGVTVVDTVTGLIDHNTITPPPGQHPWLYPKNTWWQTVGSAGPGAERWADGSRSDPVDWGSAKFVYLEYNTFNFVGHAGCTDSFGGGRMVWRYNTIVDSLLLTHGTEGSGGGRMMGHRTWEVYGNNFVAIPVGTGGGAGDITISQMRSGSGVFFDNTSIPGPGQIAYARPRLVLSANRKYESSMWPNANGMAEIDVNSGPYVKGTMHLATSGAGGGVAPTTAQPVVASVTFGPAVNTWNTNQWVKYVLTNTSGRIPANDQSYQDFGQITGNDITGKFSLQSPFGNSAPKPVDWHEGETFAIFKVEHYIDQPGWGQGDLLQQVSAVTAPNSWHKNTDPLVDPRNLQNQVNEKVYTWNSPNPPSGTMNLIVFGSDVSTDSWATVPRPGYTPLGVHPLAGGVTGPSITSVGDTFSTDAISQSKQMATSGFTHPTSVVWSITSIDAPPSAPANQLPANVTFTSGGLLSGTAVGAVVGHYILHLHAAVAADGESADGPFDLSITSPHIGPTITWTAPADGTIFNVGSIDIMLSASPLPGDSAIAKVEFYRGGSTLIGTANAPGPYEVLFSAAVGTYSLTAKVYDTFNPVATATTSPVTLTVNQVVSTLPPPTIVVTAGATGGGGGVPIITSLTFGHNKTNAISSTSSGANGGWQRELSDMWADGGRVVRIDVDSANPPSGGLPGTTGYLNSLITYAKGLGFTQFVLIGYANITWTAIPSSTSFANYMVALGQAHPDCMIELSNEPNLHNISAANYASLATAAYSAMKSAGYPNTVLLGSVGNSSSIVGGLTMMGWCQALFDNNCRLGTGFDWANYHNYGKAPPGSNNLEDWWHIYTLATAGNLGAPGNVAGKSCQSIFSDPYFAMTEFGCPLTGGDGGSNDAGNNETTQATYINDWMVSFKAQSKCLVATQYALADEAPGSGTGYGLRRIDLTHRPAWDTFFAQATSP